MVAQARRAPRRARWVAAAGLASAIAVYASLALPLLDAPLRNDELLYLAQAQAVAETGKPKRLFPATHIVVHPDSFMARYDAEYGLWHPPGYLYAVAAPVAAAGDDAVAARSFGFACGVATIALVFLIAFSSARLLGLGWGAPFAATVAAMACTVPYWIYYSLFLDPDTTVYPLVTTAALGAYVRWERARRLVPLALAFAVLHWAKVTAFGFAAIGLVLHALALRRPRRAVTLAGAALLGTALFAVTWVAYAAVAGVPTLWTVEFMQADKGGSASPGSLFDLANTTRGLGSLVGLPLVLMALLSLYGFARRVRERRVETLDALLLVGVVTALAYIVFFPYIGKYAVPAVPLVAAHVGVEVARLLRPGVVVVRRSVLAVAVAAALAIFVYQLAVVGDVITGPSFRADESRNFAGGLSDPRLPRLALAIVPLAGLALASRYLLRLRWPLALAAAAVVSLVPSTVAQALATRDHQEAWIVPSRDDSFARTVRWLDEHVDPGTRIMGEIDFAFYAPAFQIVPHDARQYYPLALLTDALDESRPEYVVMSGGEVPDDVGFLDRLAELYVPETRIGTFTIWQRRPAPPP